MTRQSQILVVPWSGGHDSTFTILQLARQGWHVQPVAIRILSNNTDQTRAEDKARSLISKHPDWPRGLVLELASIEFQHGTEKGSPEFFNRMGSGIQQFWWSILFPIVKRGNFAGIAFSYLVGEENYARLIQDLWREWSNAIDDYSFEKRKPLWVYFPMIDQQISKAILVRDFRKDFPQIARLVWFCENPEKQLTPCGICKKCRAVAAAKKERKAR